MPRPSDAERVRYLTIQDVCDRLDLSRQQVNRRIKSEVFPPPVHINPFKVRFFDELWVKKARLAVACEQRHITPQEHRDQLLILEGEEIVRSARKEPNGIHTQIGT